MNKPYAKLILFLILVVLAALCLYWKASLTPPATNTPNGQEQVKKLPDPSEVKTQKFKDTSKAELEISGEYPVDVVGSDYIKGRIDSDILKFKADNDPARFSTPVGEVMAFGPTADSPYSFVVSYKAYGNGMYLTHRVDTYTYTGGAHGGTTINAYTYNTQGKLIAPEDLFVDQAAVTKFSELVKRHAMEKNTDGMINTEWLAESAGPDVSNFSTFAINGSAIAIIFPQYSIAPYAAGIIEVSVPFSELQGILKPEFLK